MTEVSKNEKQPMVGWYNPSQLLDTGLKTLISTIIGSNADPRLVAAAATNRKFFDYSRELTETEYDFDSTSDERKEIWIDFVADVGDGWNSTASVAYSLAKTKINDLPRGEILVFGGDGVYPTATSVEYERRLIQPYRMAFDASRSGATAVSDGKTANLREHPQVFALPGNHDWYDSLVAFQKIFCTHIFNGRIFAGGWRTRQKRSYFALKLPQNWWLLGVDLQLSHNIDVPQLEYFESVIGEMKPGDNVILCVPEPYWVKAIKYEGYTTKYEEKEASIEKLEQIFTDRGIEVKLYLAGDLHHYRRFESEDGRRIQKITAGGGGAFMHPTHDFDFNKNIANQVLSSKHFTLEREYPDSAVSSSLDIRNLYGFLWNNKRFGIVTAILYPLLAFLIHGEVSGNFTLRKALTATINRCVGEPLALILVILMVMGLVFFTDSHSTIYRRIAGTIHGLAHLTVIFFLGWLGFLLMRYVVGPENFNSLVYQNEHMARINLIWLGAIILVCGVGGYIFGSFIMGTYLYLSLHFFKRHDNEAFSALKIEDFKNFLRLHINQDGKLTIYPFKIERVEREWIDKVEGNEVVGREPKNSIKPELIESIDPIG